MDGDTSTSLTIATRHSEKDLHKVADLYAKALDIQKGDVVLDPMCGRGVPLCEAATNWPEAAAFLGCDISASQIYAASENA